MATLRPGSLLFDPSAGCLHRHAPDSRWIQSPIPPLPTGNQTPAFERCLTAMVPHAGGIAAELLAEKGLELRCRKFTVFPVTQVCTTSNIPMDVLPVIARYIAANKEGDGMEFFRTLFALMGTCKEARRDILQLLNCHYIWVQMYGAYQNTHGRFAERLLLGTRWYNMVHDPLLRCLYPMPPLNEFGRLPIPCSQVAPLPGSTTDAGAAYHQALQRLQHYQAHRAEYTELMREVYPRVVALNTLARYNRTRVLCMIVADNPVLAAAINHTATWSADGRNIVAVTQSTKLGFFMAGMVPPICTTDDEELALLFKQQPQFLCTDAPFILRAAPLRFMAELHGRLGFLHLMYRNWPTMVNHVQLYSDRPRLDKTVQPTEAERRNVGQYIYRSRVPPGMTRVPRGGVPFQDAVAPLRPEHAFSSDLTVTRLASSLDCLRVLHAVTGRFETVFPLWTTYTHWVATAPARELFTRGVPLPRALVAACLEKHRGTISMIVQYVKDSAAMAMLQEVRARDMEVRQLNAEWTRVKETDIYALRKMRQEITTLTETVTQLRAQLGLATVDAVASHTETMSPGIGKRRADSEPNTEPDSGHETQRPRLSEASVCGTVCGTVCDNVPSNVPSNIPDILTADVFQ